jgi:hypothetical protein
MRSEAAGLSAPGCWPRHERGRDGKGSQCPSPRIARGTAHRLTARRLRTGTRELGVSARPGAGLAAMAGEGHAEGGASLVVGARESRVHGKGKQEDDRFA